MMPFKKGFAILFSSVFIYILFYTFYFSLKQFHNADKIAIHFFMDMVRTAWNIFLYSQCPVGVTSEHM